MKNCAHISLDYPNCLERNVSDHCLWNKCEQMSSMFSDGIDQSSTKTSMFFNSSQTDIFNQLNLCGTLFYGTEFKSIENKTYIDL